MDIQSALIEIAASGMSDSAIGKKVGAPQSIITRLRNGKHKTTSWERGRAIVDLAAEVRASSARCKEPA